MVLRKEFNIRGNSGVGQGPSLALNLYSAEQIAERGIVTTATETAVEGAATGFTRGEFVGAVFGALTGIGLVTWAWWKSRIDTTQPPEPSIPPLTPTQLRCLTNPYDTSAECAIVRGAASLIPFSDSFLGNPNAARASAGETTSTPVAALTLSEAATLATPTDLSKPGLWFEPSGRSAILVNGAGLFEIEQWKSSLAIYYTSHKSINLPDRYTRLLLASEANDLAQRLELMLSGQIQLESVRPSYFDKLSGRDKEDTEHKMRWLIEWRERPLRQEATEARHHRGNAMIQKVGHVFPDEDMTAGLMREVEKVRRLADDHHLTYVMISGPAVPDALYMGPDRPTLTPNEFRRSAGQHDPTDPNGVMLSPLAHEELLTLLDTIPGKKIVVMATPYSGNFVEAVRRHSRATDYAVLASTSADEPSVEPMDAPFIKAIAARLIFGEPLSAIRMVRIQDPHNASRSQTPTQFLGFDTVF